MKRARAYIILLLVVLATACTTQRKAHNAYNRAMATGPLDAIIVPGIPYRNAGWGTLMQRRVTWAAILYRNGVTKNIIFSGGAVYSPYKEAVVMGMYAQQLGIPPEHIFYDTLARHTIENVYYSYLIAKKQGFKRLAVCTDKYQNFFLQLMVRQRFAGAVTQVPVITDSIKKYQRPEPHIDAAAALIKDTAHFVPLNKADNLRQRLGGMMGKDIPWYLYPMQRLPEL